MSQTCSYIWLTPACVGGANVDSTSASCLHKPFSPPGEVKRVSAEQKKISNIIQSSES